MGNIELLPRGMSISFYNCCRDVGIDQDGASPTNVVAIDILLDILA